MSTVLVNILPRPFVANGNHAERENFPDPAGSDVLAFKTFGDARGKIGI